MKLIETTSFAAFIWRFVWTERNAAGKVLFLVLWPVFAVSLLAMAALEAVSNLTRRP